jgi:RNA polymerase sigma-70 factor, ECF subfamily
VPALAQSTNLRTGPFAVTVPSDSSTDDALVRAAQTGDRSAFGLLYARYARMVHGILLSRVPLADVDDLVQDVFLQAMPRLHTLRDVSRFPGWLAAIARNRAIDFHRRAKSDVALDDPSVAETDPPPPTTRRTPQASAEARIALEAILSLPETYRETLILRLVEGMTGPEIAARTGLTHGSVRVNLHRGMQQLREILGQRAAHAGGGDV